MLKRFPTTGVLLIVMGLLFLSMELLGGSKLVPILLVFGAMTVEAIQWGDYWNLVTPMFLHIGLLHLCFNGFALYQLGPICESIFGPARFLLSFVVCGIAGNLVSFAAHENNVIVAGASGALFGLVGLLLVAAWTKHTTLRPEARRALIRGLSPFLIYNLIFGLVIDGIDNWNHVGGLLMGAGLGLFLMPGRQTKVWRVSSWLSSVGVIVWAFTQQVRNIFMAG